VSTLIRQQLIVEKQKQNCSFDLALAPRGIADSIIPVVDLTDGDICPLSVQSHHFIFAALLRWILLAADC
jgi:hypothetical protein